MTNDEAWREVWREFAAAFLWLLDRTKTPAVEGKIFRTRLSAGMRSVWTFPWEDSTDKLLDISGGFRVYDPQSLDERVQRATIFCLSKLYRMLGEELPDEWDIPGRRYINDDRPTRRFRHYPKYGDLTWHAVLAELRTTVGHGGGIE